MDRSHRLAGLVGAAALMVPMLGVLGWPAPTASAAPACTTSWNGGVGSWEDASRWSGGAVPGRADVVCITAGSGAAPVVAVTADETIESLVMSGATLQAGRGVLVNVSNFDLVGSTVAGPGRVVAQRAPTFQSYNVRSILSDVTVSSGGLVGLHNRLLTLSGVIGLSGGSTLDLDGQPQLQRPPRRIMFSDGARVADLDGDAANQVLLTGEYVSAGTARIDVSTVASGSLVLVSGDLALPRLNLLRPGGALVSNGDPPLHTPSLQVGSTGHDATLDLSRSVFAIAQGMSVTISGGGQLRAPDGTDALTSLRLVAGGLSTFDSDEPLVLPGKLRIASDGIVSARDVQVPAVEVGGLFAAKVVETSRVTGTARDSRVVVGDYNSPIRAQVGAFASAGIVEFLATSMSSLDLSDTSTTDLLGGANLTIVRGSAHLAGALYTTPGDIHDGSKVVVLAVHGEIEGQFSSATNFRDYTVTLTYQPHRVVATFHATR